MKQKSGPVKQPAEGVVRDLRRATRRQFSAEEKIRIVLEGLRGEESIAELCRREGIASSSASGYELLDAVYTTGERFVAERMEVRLRPGPGTPHTPLILDFIYEPILDEDDNV